LAAQSCSVEDPFLTDIQPLALTEEDINDLIVADERYKD
jgi:hypothetical protein